MLTVRSALPSDLRTARFVEIVARAMYRPDDSTMADFITKAQRSNATVRVACAGDQVLGVIVSEEQDDATIEITSIAAAGFAERQGVGTALVLDLLSRHRGVSVVAETDDDAVGFYRTLGFSITSLGERHPGVTRYRCVSDMSG